VAGDGGGELRRSGGQRQAPGRRRGKTYLSGRGRGRGVPAALAPVNALSDALKLQWDSRSEEYLERCKTSPIWRGEVVMG
jgi:hypothetical protein